VADERPTGPIRQAHVVVRGRVQRVNFRWLLLQWAQSQSVGGWVRNRDDGSVEAIIQGPPDRVQSVVDWMRHGPPHARVDSLDETWSDVDRAAEAFEITG
jgi:acylphosphatase